jgi:hypothetical protein
MKRRSFIYLLSLIPFIKLNRIKEKEKLDKEKIIATVKKMISDAMNEFYREIDKTLFSRE